MIYTIHENCQNCVKCISVCPVVGANTVKMVDDEPVITIDQDRCIECGSCIGVCKHHARDYEDDTEAFFNDLKNGEQFAVITAPSIKTNIPNYTRLFGYISSLGKVDGFYDVSFGADITVWGVLKNIGKGSIAQPCPSIVNYIERYKPELLTELSKIQSPVMCTAIYLKKYQGIASDIVLLSPCIAKRTEIRRRGNNQYIKYNVTFKKLMEYIKKNDIDLMDYPNLDFLNRGDYLGTLFPEDGGLSKNIRSYLGEKYYTKLEGHKMYQYLSNMDPNSNRKGKPILVDCLSCENGCNYGSGSCNEMSTDEVGAMMQAAMEKVSKHAMRKQQAAFNRKLKIEDFKVSYEDKYIGDTPLTEEDYNKAFMMLEKVTKEDREVDCEHCGYTSCRQFAEMVFRNRNIPENCRFYRNKVALKNQKDLFDMKARQMQREAEEYRLRELDAMRKQEKIKKIQNDINRIKEAVEQISAGNEDSARENEKVNMMMCTALMHLKNIEGVTDNIFKNAQMFQQIAEIILNIAEQTTLLSLNARIEAARAGQEGFGFDVVAEEIQKLADQTSDNANKTTERVKEINKAIDSNKLLIKEFVSLFGDAAEAVTSISGITEEISAQGQELNAMTNMIFEESKGL